MLSKIIHLEPYFPTGELTVQPVVLWNNGRAHVEGISKHASVGTEYFKTITPIPGHSIVYVLAVSAWERYGENRNGDGFPEQPYRPLENPPWIGEEDILSKHYKSFDEFGYNYRSHVNTDPAKSVGKVIKAFWNSTMWRVELLVDLNNALAPDLAERIAAGEFPPVSMGTKVPYDVCLLPETLVRTSTGHKAIKDIEIGETVRTHTGLLKRVTAHYVHETDEDLYTVTASGVAHPITSTGKHPFLILKKEDVRTCTGSVGGERLRHKLQKDVEPTCSRCNRVVELKPEWTSAEDIRVGDYALVPVDACNPKDTVGVALATVLGFYLGNGSVSWSERHETAYNTSTPRIKFPSGVQFSMNLNQEDCIKRLCDALDELALPNGWHRYDNSDKTEAAIHVFGPEFATSILELGGSKSKEKKIHESVFSWSVNEKSSVLGGYLDTDGSVDVTKGSGRILSTNPALLIDTQRLGLSAGLHVTVGNAGHSTSFDGTANISTYYAFVAAHDLQQLKPYSAKASWTQKVPQYGKPKSFFWGSYWCTPVKKIESTCDTTNVVHNLAVEDDESYLAVGVAVHNCSICGNRAPTRAQYCEHLRFQMRDVINGLKVAALNPKPKFFDISWVVRPADPTAYMLKKVAEERPYEITGAAAGEYLDEMAERKLAAHKLAVIDKVVQGIPVDAKTEGVDPVELSNIQKMRPEALRMGSRMPTMSDNTLRELSQHPLNRIVNTTLASGMLLNTPEITKIIIYKSYPQTQHIPDDLIDRVVATQGGIMKLFEDMPQLLDGVDASGIFDIAPSHIDQKIAALVMPYMEKRSGIMEYLQRKFTPQNYYEESQQTTPLSLTDPASGQQYSTTRGAAIAAHDEVAKRNLYKVVGGAGLLGGAYKMMSSGLRAKGLGGLRPLVGATLAGVGLSNMPTMGRHYMTDQGIPIPITTELAKTSSASSLALPMFGTLGLMGLAAHDYHSRLERGEPEVDPYAPLGERLVNNLESTAVNHPILTALGGTMLGRAVGQTPAAQYALKNFIRPLAQRGKMQMTGAGSHVSDWAKRTDETFKNWARNTEKMSADISGMFEMTPTDTVALPKIDFNKVAELIGEILVG